MSGKVRLILADILVCHFFGHNPLDFADHAFDGLLHIGWINTCTHAPRPRPHATFDAAVGIVGQATLLTHFIANPSHHAELPQHTVDQCCRTVIRLESGRPQHTHHNI